MDCDDIAFLLARETPPTDEESVALDDHVATCETCAELMVERSQYRLALPAVDPAWFELGEQIAAGGMGKITRAFDRRLGREVAIKEMLSVELRARFEREALITARLQHPAIVPIYEAGTWPNGHVFYTMRLVPGGTLADAIAKRTTLEARLDLLPHVIAMTEAVAYAHSRGIIHRDLKPENVLIGEFGETVVIDWGLAKDRGSPDDAPTNASDSASDLTHVGAVFGTPSFLSPEQARGEELDERADVFSLGAILYTLLAGTPPYRDMIEPARTPREKPARKRAASEKAASEHADTELASPSSARDRAGENLAGAGKPISERANTELADEKVRAKVRDHADSDQKSAHASEHADTELAASSAGRRLDGKALIAAVLAGPPTPIDEPRAPADLLAIVERAMSRDLATRYRTASQLAEEMRRFQAGQLLVSRRYRVRDRIARWVKRHRAIVASAGVAAVALAIVASIAIVKITSAQDAEREQRTIAERAFEIGERKGQRKLCAASIPTLASPWDPAARDLVHHAFARSKLPYVAQTLERIDAGFDRWSSELAAARDLVCDERNTERPQLAAELECLAERTGEARALISQFHDVDEATVRNALGAVEALAPIARCTTPQQARVMPAPSAAREKVRELFARTHALMALGKFRDALPLTRDAVTGADALGEPGLRAAARVALGVALAGTSDLDGASRALQEALRLADAAQDDRSRALAWVNLVRIEYWRGRPEQAVAMQNAVLGATDRIGDQALATEAMLHLGGALGQTGKHTEAQAMFEEAVTIRRKLYGDGDRRLGFALSALGNSFAMQGKLDAGIAAHREALEIGKRTLGSAHPSVGVMHGNLASDYLYGLQPAAALGELETYLASVEGAYGPKHRDVAMALTGVGMAHLELGQYERALEVFARADATWRDVNAKHPVVADVLLGRYLAQQKLGKPASVADLETALGLAKGLPPFQRARVQLVLGQAIGGPRALELVKASRDGFATSTLPLVQRELAVAKAWLAARGQ